MAKTERDTLLRATSDLHVTQRTWPWVLEALKEMRADAQEHGGITFILGDVLDQAHTAHMRTYIDLRQMLWMWPGRVYVLAGNHDQFGDGWDNALVALNGGSCKVISMPIWGRYGRFLPYTKPDRFKAELDRITGAPIRDKFLLPMVWCHHGFRGAYVNAMRQDREGVSCLDIPEGHVVVSGHYHMPQNLGRIVYCGSPYETSFAEEGQAKGWLRWEDATKDSFPVRIPFGPLGAPRHYTIEWSPEQGPPEVPAGMLATDRPRIVTKATRREVMAAAEQLDRAGLGGVPVLAAPTQGSERGVVDTRLGPKDAVGRYISSVFGPDTSRPDPREMEEFAEEAELWAD